MRSLIRRSALGALTALGVAATLVPAQAVAGYYDVQICRNGYGNGGALTASGGGAQYDWLFRVTNNNCDTGWGGWNGISASVTNGGAIENEPYVPPGVSANLYAAAPAGAGIEKVHIDSGRFASHYGNATGWNARVMVPSAGWCRTDGTNGSWCGLGNQRPADNSYETVWAAPDYPQVTDVDLGPITGPVSDIAIGVVCNGGSTYGARPCYRMPYKNSAGVSVASGYIRVRDDSAPSVSPIGGSVADGQWHRPGDIALTVSGSDNTGIRAFERYIDGNWAGRIDQNCDYSRMKPCSDRTIDTTANVTGYDGSHTVQIAAYAATQADVGCPADCAVSGVKVAIDGTAPGAPASKNNGPTWSTSNAFNLTAPTPASENDPDGDGPQGRSPIARRIAAVCPTDAQTASDARCKTTDVSPVAGSNQPASAAVTAPGEGTWKAFVSLVDEAGNTGRPSDGVAINVDRTAPVVAVDQTRGGFVLVNKDSLSGPAGVTYRVDGKGDWISLSGDLVDGARVAKVPATPGQHYVEVKGADNAGNVSGVARFDVTVPNNDGNVKSLDEFGSDAQLAVVDRGELNGAGGSEKATLTAWFVKKAKANDKKPNLSTRTIGEKDTAAIEGLLVDGAGKAIANARIDLGAAIAAGRSEIKKGAATTNADGNFSIALPKGQTSRDLTVAYMARVNDAKPAASAGLRLVVKARLSFTAHKPKVGRVKFTGFVSSGYLTKAGVRVEIQWWNPKAREWDPFGSVRTDQKGRWSWKRLFTARSTYRMRAFVPSNPAYAYKGGASRVKVVRIR